MHFEIETTGMTRKEFLKREAEHKQRISREEQRHKHPILRNHYLAAVAAYGAMAKKDVESASRLDDLLSNEVSSTPPTRGSPDDANHN